MNHRRDSGGDVVHVIPTENSFPYPGDGAIWATEDEYNLAVWGISSGESAPPSKKTRGLSPSPSSSSASASKAVGKIFFKTKLCCKFRSGTCPYTTNCYFAHTMEELRRPPPNRQEMVSVNGDEKDFPAGALTTETREEFQIPSLVSSCVTENGRSNKGRHCKKFYTEEGCPYGDTCTFMHDEASRNRESVAISLGPNPYGGGVTGGNVIGGGGGNGGGSQTVKPSNWKTRICNKWEITGYCPFGGKCHFAHGAAELHKYGGGLVEGGANEGEADTGPTRKGQMDKMSILQTGVSHGHGDVSSSPRPSSSSAAATQKPRTLRIHHKWKGPNKISRIYGDWIDDFE